MIYPLIRPFFQHTMEYPLDPPLHFSIPRSTFWIRPCISKYHGIPSGSAPAFQHAVVYPLDPPLLSSIPWYTLWIRPCLAACHGIPPGSTHVGCYQFRKEMKTIHKCNLCTLLSGAIHEVGQFSIRCQITHRMINWGCQKTRKEVKTTPLCKSQ